jgi:hypothetical protein
VKPETRLILVFLVRLAFIVFAGWVALVPETLPNSHMVVRIGLAATFLVLSILVGEVAKLRMHFDMLVRAVRAARAEVTGESPARDDSAAVAILIRALGSREVSTREKAHTNLVRITGQDLPLDQQQWIAWWDQQQKEAAGEE